MKKTCFMALMAALICVMLPSCLNTRDEQFTVTQNYSNYVNSVLDYSTNEMYESTGVGYTVVYNYGNQTAKVSITGLRLPDGTLYPTLTFEKVPYNVNNAGWREIYITNATPEGSGGFVQAPKFSSLTMQVIDRVAGQYSIPSLTYIKYTIGDWEFNSIPTQMVFSGTTTVKSETGEYTPGKDDPTTYGVVLDPAKHTAMITIAYAKFAAAMPAQNMRFKDIPYQITADGSLVLERQEPFVPYLLSGSSSAAATETPYESFPISGLMAHYRPNRAFALDFDCTMMKNGAAVASYKVHMIDQFPTEQFTPQQ